MSKFGMVVDLHKCTGCGGCVLACKIQNNVQDGFKWCDAKVEIEGTFPNVKYSHMTTMCNHCSNAPCVENCPTGAMYKSENGITMHNPEECIGCKMCQQNCPYGVISFNDSEPHPFWRDELGKEVVEAVDGEITPYYNPEVGFRPKEVVEKCLFCYQRTTKGQQPYCVETCPSYALTFGDLDDSNSEVSKLLQQYDATRLLEERGTEPNVYYIRKYSR